MNLSIIANAPRLCPLRRPRGSAGAGTSSMLDPRVRQKVVWD